MNLKPLGDRILIKPEIPPDVTESGIIIAEDRKPEQTGTVVAVGPCSHPRRIDAMAAAILLDGWSKAVSDMAKMPKDFTDNMGFASALLRDLVRKEPEVKVGDYVVFSWTSGQEIWVEDGAERYLLMRESDILCVVEGLTV